MGWFSIQLRWRVDRSRVLSNSSRNKWTPNKKDSKEQPIQLLKLEVILKKNNLAICYTVKWSDIRITRSSGIFEFWLGTIKKKKTIVENHRCTQVENGFSKSRASSMRLSCVIPEVGKAGVIILPIWGGIKHYKSMVIFWDFPHSNALFGLVNSSLSKRKDGTTEFMSPAKKL